VRLPSLCTLSALRGTSGGATMTTLGGACPRYSCNSSHARFTGFYHRVRAPRIRAPALRFAPPRWGGELAKKKPNRSVSIPALMAVVLAAVLVGLMLVLVMPAD
jgi:hypothetical protein